MLYSNHHTHIANCLTIIINNHTHIINNHTHIVLLMQCVVQEVWNTICIARKRKQLTARTVLLLSLRCFLKIVYLELMVILSLMVTSIITEVGKIYRGRHRPWFLQACNPDFSKINCTDAFGNPLLVEESVCRPNHTSALIEARKSWPSGHSSVIFCGMTISMVCTDMLVCVCVCVCVCTCVCVCVCVCTCVCIVCAVCTCVCIVCAVCICLCACLCVCITIEFMNCVKVNCSILFIACFHFHHL